MTLREKIADWISGGALSRARRSRDIACDNMLHYQKISMTFINTLDTISKMETPSANATVRRMARTAREALR